MKYKKGTFVIVPNINTLENNPPELQTLFMWLCIYANEDGNCYPARKTLAKKCGVSVKTVDRYISKLIELKLIEKQVRKKIGTKENISNLYQICIIDTDTLGEELKSPHIASESLDPSDTDDTGTISNITIPNINNTIDTSVSITLPIHRGKTSHQRLDSIYIDLYNNLYSSKPSYADIGKRQKIFKDLLKVYTELQIATLLIIFFNWNGMDNQSEREKDYLIKNAHSITLFKYDINKYELYTKNVSGYKDEFEESGNRLLEFVGNWIINLTNK